MSVAKVIEIIASSKTSFEDAIQQGVSRAAETIGGISGIWVKDQKASVSGSKITEYRVVMKVTFVLNPPSKASSKAPGKKKK
jgi:dodecin